jgi:RNA polymerase sigma-70 factor (ECF subfamily)
MAPSPFADAASLEALVRTEGPRLLAIARHLLAQEDDAQTAVKEAFAAAIANPGDAAASSLSRQVVQAAIGLLRARPRAAEDAIEDLVPRFLPNGHHTEQFAPWPDTSTDRAQRLSEVRESLMGVPESFRLVLVLHDVEGLSTDDIAAALGLTANAVKIRLHRARMALRTRLAERWAGGA